MSKRAIVIASFGTTNRSARAASLDAIEADIRLEFPDIEIRHAYTSPTVRRIMHEKQGITVVSLREALDALKEERYTEVICCPTYVMNGFEYDDMRKAAAEYRDGFSVIRCCEPLMSVGNVEPLIHALEDAIGITEEFAYVMVGHGTGHPSNRVYGELEQEFHGRGHKNVFVGTIESRPGIDETIQKLKLCGNQKVVLMPLLTVAGVHAAEDIFGDAHSWLSSIRQAGFTVTCLKKGLCEYPEIRRLLIDSIGRQV